MNIDQVYRLARRSGTELGSCISSFQKLRICRGRGIPLGWENRLQLPKGDARFYSFSRVWAWNTSLEGSSHTTELEAKQKPLCGEKH